MSTLGFVLGPGQAYAIGQGWESLGFEGAGTLGLTFAAVGFLWAYFGGVFRINYGIKKGWVTKEEINATGKTKKLKLRSEPIPVTCYKIDEHIFLDATADEEEVADGRLTVTLYDKKNVTTLQKAGPVGFSVDEIKKCINIATEKAAEIRSLTVASK